MENLIEILRTFPKEEIQQLGLFVKSPIFNTKKRLIAFYEVTLTYHPSFAGISNEAVFFTLNPTKKTYNKRAFRSSCLDFLALVKKYLIFCEQQKDKRQQERALLAAALRREQLSLFEKELKKAKNRQKQDAIIELDYLFHQFKLEKINYEYNIIYQNRNISFSPEAVNKSLNNYYLLNKIRLGLSALMRPQILNQAQDMSFTKETLVFLKGNPIDEVPLISLYYNSYLLFQDLEKEAYFFRIKKLLQKHATAISPYELRQMLLSSINYCRLRYNDGHHQFKEEEFALYEILIEQQVLYVGKDKQKQFISPNHFRSITEASLFMARQGKSSFQWTADFIEAYKDKVLLQYQDSVYNYCMAAFHFAQDQFKETQKYLGKIQQEKDIDFFYTIYAKTLEIQTAYEMKEWVFLDYQLDSYRQFIRRNTKISANFRDAYSNFHKLSRKLYKRRTNNRSISQEEKTALKGEIISKKPLRERLWLLEKVDQL